MNSNKEYDVWIIDPHGRIPGEEMGHLIGIEAAKYYADRGEKVLLISSSFSHILKKQRNKVNEIFTVYEGVDLVLLKANSYVSHTGLGRIIWHFYFCFNFLMNYKSWHKPDFITVSFPFPFFDLLIPKIKRSTGATIILHFSDLWPEIFEILLPQKLKGLGAFIFSPFYWMRSVAMKAADGITFVSDNYHDLLVREIPEIANKSTQTIHRSLLSISDITKRKTTENKFIKNKKNRIFFNYSGTLGAGYDIENLLECTQLLSLEYPGSFKVFISGAGPKANFVKKFSDKLNSDEFEYLGLLSAEELNDLYAATDYGLMPYSVGTTVDFPAKVFDYIVAARPIIHSNTGELATFTQTHECGYYFRPGDKDALLDVLRQTIIKGHIDQKRLSSNMSKLSHEFDKNRTLERMYDFLYHTQNSMNRE